MRIPAHHDRSEGGAAQAMTPMIDVVFLLLIFFVLASVGRRKESLLSGKLAGGTVDAQKLAEEQHLLGEVKLFLRTAPDGGTVFLLGEGGREIGSFEALEAHLKELARLSSDVPLILDVGGEVPLEDVLRVKTLARRLRFENVLLAAQPGGQP